MVVNGFEFTGRLVGTSACYYVAKRGDVVYTSKSMTYLMNKTKNTPPLGTSEFKNGSYVAMK